MWTRIEVYGALVRAARTGRAKADELLALLAADLSPEGAVTMLADCALVVLAAARHGFRILSFDERHFRAVRPLYGDSFTILPLDV